MIVRELVAKFGFAVDKSGLDQIDKSIDNAKKGLGQVAERAQRVGGTLTTFVTLPILGIGAAAIKAASDSEEAFSKFGTVFKDVEGQANAAAKNLASSFGLSSTAARELLGDTGDLLSGFGFSGEAALDLSKQVNELAVDLASFTNFQGGASGASAALTKALLGERESIKSLGISILENDVKQRVALNTQKGLTFETERQAKAYATLQLAQEQSKNAIGDFQRTNKGFANQLRILRARVSDVAVGFGKILIPIANRAVGVLIKLFEKFQNLSRGSKIFILALLGVIALIGPLILLISTLVIGVVSAIGAFTGLAATLGITNVALLLLIAKFALIAAAVVAAFAIVFLVIDDLIAYFNGESSVFGTILASIDEFIMKWGEAFNGLPGPVKAAIAAITTPIRIAVGLVRSLGGALGALVGGGGFSGAFDAIKETLGESLGTNPLENGISGLLGFGPSASTSTTPTSSGTQTNNITNSVSVEVPAGTPPEEVGEASRQGVENAMNSLIQDTRRQIASPIRE